MKRPRILWMVFINGYGIEGPTKMIYNNNLKSWWDKDGNQDCLRRHLAGPGWRQLVFASKKDADNAMLGANAVMAQLREFCA